MTSLLSILIASYYSIKRLILENLPSLKFEPLINLISINAIIANGSYQKIIDSYLK